MYAKPVRRISVELYSAPECSLCGPVETLLSRVADELGLDVQKFDITQDSALEARFRTEIPVVFLDGRKAYKYRVDEAELRRRVERLRDARDPREATE